VSFAARGTVSFLRIAANRVNFSLLFTYPRLRARSGNARRLEFNIRSSSAP